MNYCNLNKFVALFGIRRFLEFRTAATKTVISADGKDVPKRKSYENRITLIGSDNSISIIDLKNAQSLSIRRDLKLVKVQDVDSKTRRPIYKLMTNAEYHAEELAKRKEKQVAREGNTIKGQKLMTFSSRIGEHDLLTNVRKMLKLVEKQYEVKVVITGDDAEAAQKSENIYSVIENHVKSASKVVQKRVRGTTLRFQLLPQRAGSGASGSDQRSDGKGPL